MVGFTIKNWLKERNPNYKKQKEQISLAWNYYDERQHDQAKEIIENVLKEKPSNNEIHISCLILKSELLNRTGEDFKKSYELANEAVELSEKENNQHLILQANLVKFSSLADQGDNSTISELVQKIDRLYEKYLLNKDDIEISAKYYGLKGLYFGKIGKIDLSIENFKKSADFEEKSGKIYNLVTCLNNIGLCYSIKDDAKKSIDYLFNAIEIIKERGEESKFAYLLAYIYATVGTQFGNQGELDEALDYLQKSIEFSISTKNLDSESACLADIGDIFLKKGEYDQAIQYYKQALTIFIQNGNQKFEMTLLVALLSVYILIHDKENINTYFDQITSKYKEFPNDPYFSTNYMFSKALVLKDSSRLADKVEAQKIFKELYNKDEIYTYVTKESILYYLELLIEEMKLSANESLMNEIEDTSKKLMNLAKNQGSHSLIIESMLINAKISIIKLDFNHARYLLTQAQISAEEKGLKLLSQKISHEHDYLLNKMNQWEDTVSESATIKERLELSNIENILRNMIKNSYTTSEEEQDRGLILLIVNIGGLAIYSNKFRTEGQVEEQIVASLLTAINSFSQEAFNTKESIERIKLGENTVIMKKLHDLNFCYAFKGPSYFASKKLNQFISDIQNNKIILNDLLNFESFLPEKTILTLNDLVNKSFSLN